MPTAARKAAQNKPVESTPPVEEKAPENPFSVGNDALDMFFQMLADKVSKYKAIDSQLAAADGDKEKAVQGFIDSSDDPEVVKRREMIATLAAELKAFAESAVSDSQLTDEQKENLKTERETLKTGVQNGRKAIIATADAFSAQVPREDVLAVLEKIGDPTKSNRGRKAGATGSSLPRANVLITVNGGNLKDTKFENFSSCAAKLNPGSDSPAKDLIEAFATAAGVDYENVKTVDKPVEFEFTPEGTNASTYKISTKPKPRSKPGPNSSGKTDTAEESKTEETPKVETPAA